ncbi:MAG: DNA mismatch repair endonuclease MutL [Gammaproteobacteria bacterium]
MSQSQAVPVHQPIRRLPPYLANQIAAGEVVERPASIVKELVENSLDAGARRITVILKQGGLQYISVQDDGLGIPVDELPLALAPHATSKISRVEDLSAITSMGFRGEALASIGSVARLQITSRHHDAERGWTVYGPAARDNPVPAAHPPGTTLTVQELFFNTPARRRFLRSERTEYRHCEDVIRRMALSRFDVGFVLQHNQRPVFNLPAALDEAAKQQRVMRLCGPAFMQQAVALEFQHSGMQLQGWIGLPKAARPQSDLQYIFVNGRIIRDRVISHALRQAYADRLYPGRHPAYVLYLTLNPAEIDVNVHPTKHEVRFHQSRLVHDFLVRCVDEALSQQGESPSLPYAREPLDWHMPATGNIPASRANTAPGPVPSTVAEMAPSYPLFSSAKAANSLWPVLTVLHDRYALCEHPEGLIVINIPQLQRENLTRQFDHLLSTGMPRRPLLIPLNINLDNDVAWIERYHELFEQVGFDLGVSGKHSILVRRSPVVLERTDLAQLVPIWLQELAGQQPLELDMLLQTLVRLAPDFPASPWQACDLSHLLTFLAEAGNPLAHPAVSLLNQATLDGLFRP